jgi:site-specific DNA recombinase
VRAVHSGVTTGFAQRYAPVVTKKRCAVYVRVSDDENLDQEYTTLDAQRDAGLAYIRSQAHEGWAPVSDDYRDDGYSAGSLNRPALKRLLDDVQAGRIDVVVIYKIDRLTRSLRDFFRMLDVFEQHGVSFVSVTQQFNTSTAMGRLIVNILLSFAQFEREQGAERIRDKIAASKARGMWMGGMPPLGYDVKERRLVVNEQEAELVREIFRRYAEHGSAAQLVRELQAEGRTTKSWTTQQGVFRPGRPIDQQFLFTLLRNRVYLGEVAFKGKVYPGQHEAIVSRELWDAAHVHVERRRQGPRPRKAQHPALLAGLMFAPDGQLMVPTYTKKPNGKRYRYYVPYLYKRRAAGATTRPGQRSLGPLPAAEIEAAVLQQIHQTLLQPEMLIAAWKACQWLPNCGQIDEAQAIVSLKRIGDVWEQLFPAEQQRIARLLIDRVQLHDAGLDIVWRDEGWTGFGPDVVQHPFVEEERLREVA